jgi:hypothetical protein
MPIPNTPQMNTPQMNAPQMSAPKKTVYASSVLSVDPHGSRTWQHSTTGKLHREDGPAVEWVNGTREWWRNGLRHREGGPAVRLSDGSREWWQNGNLHREDGPAIMRSDGTLLWYLHGECHREDGPAITRPDGTREWYLSSRRLTEEQHTREMGLIRQARAEQARREARLEVLRTPEAQQAKLAEIRDRLEHAFREDV